MRWTAPWSRRRPVRKYVPPAGFPDPPLEELVEEGLLIALAGVRMSVKNRILVRILRDGVDVDLDWCTAVVGSELHALALESADNAKRLAGQLVGKRPEVWVDGDAPLYEPARLPRRQQLLSMLAARLQELATDEQQVRELAIASRDAALHDMVSARMLPSRRVAGGRASDRVVRREAALAQLRADLDALADEHDD